MLNFLSITHPRLQVLRKTQRGFSDFWISGQSVIKENCHKSRIGGNIDMKLRPVTKIDKINKQREKKIGDDVISASYDVIFIFRNYGQFGAIQRRDSGRIVCKTYILLIVTFFLTKTEKSRIHLSHYCFA